MENVMGKVYIEIDASPWMDETGVLTSVWLGDACEECYERLSTYEELVEKNLEAYTVYNKLIGDNADEAELFVKKLEEVAVFARKRFEELKDVE